MTVYTPQPTQIPYFPATPWWCFNPFRVTPSRYCYRGDRGASSLPWWCKTPLQVCARSQGVNREKGNNRYFFSVLIFVRMKKSVLRINIKNFLGIEVLKICPRFKKDRYYTLYYYQIATVGINSTWMFFPLNLLLFI